MAERVKMAIELMKANLKEPLSLSQAAREAKPSASHLSQLFRTAIGQSPGRYLMILRLQRAAELLVDSTRSVKETMHTVGFKDKSNFVRSFKKAYGLSPSAYRAKKFNPTRAERIARLTNRNLATCF